MPDLTPDLLARSRVIAKGRRIREVQRLVEMYGGRPSQWVKKSSPSIHDQQGQYEYHWYEYHWYEHHGVGRVEVKVVKIS